MSSEFENNPPVDPVELPQPEAADQQTMTEPPGEPQPVRQTDPVLTLLKGVVCLAVAGGASLLLVGGSVGRTMGATRSAQLKWEQRQEEIRQVAAEYASSSQPAALEGAGNEHE